MGAEHDKGKRLERATGKFFLEHDGPCPEFEEMTTSTGRVGHHTHIRVDVLSKNYAVECKARESLPVWLMDAYRQINARAEALGKAGCLVIKQDYAPELHIITREHHEELLKEANDGQAE